MIHDTALVSPDADLAADVAVGPGAIVDAGCVVGAGTTIQARAVVTGTSVIGPGTLIGYGAIVGAEPQDVSFGGGPSRVVVGARCRIREYATVHRGTEAGSETVIGDDCFIMVGAHVAHNCVLGDRVTMANNVLLAGYVEIGAGCFLGGGSVVHQFTRLGRLAVMRGNTRIGKDVPPFCMAVDTNEVFGVNLVGLKRAGFDAEARRDIRDAYRLLYHGGLNVGQALDRIEADFDRPEVAELVAFVRASKRGICGARPLGRKGEED